MKELSLKLHYLVQNQVLAKMVKISRKMNFIHLSNSNIRIILITNFTKAASRNTKPVSRQCFIRDSVEGASTYNLPVLILGVHRVYADINKIYNLTRHENKFLQKRNVRGIEPGSFGFKGGQALHHRSNIPNVTYTMQRPYRQYAYMVQQVHISACRVRSEMLFNHWYICTCT